MKPEESTPPVPQDAEGQSDDESELLEEVEEEREHLVSTVKNVTVLVPETTSPSSGIPPFHGSTEACLNLKPSTAHGYLKSVSGTGLRYGTEKTTDDGKSVTYCVHGKPSGCCATLVGTGSPGTPFPIQVKQPEHCHKPRGEEMDTKARRKLILAAILCLLFMSAEIAGGILSGSLAIATDAAHLLTDFAAFMISLFAIWVGQRKPTRMMPFGWYRAEVIGALTSVLTIWLVTGILVYMAIMRIIENDFHIEATVMLITSGVAIIVNIIMGLTLHQHGHVHGGVSERSVADMEIATPQSNGNQHSNKNINVRAAYIHVIGDFFQSIGVFIAAIIIYFNEDWKIADPICTFLFSILVLMTTFQILKDTILVLMEGMPRDIDFNEVLETFLTIEGVVAVHNLRIWALSLGKTALAAHLAIEENANPSEILTKATTKIHEKYNFFEMTLQIEHFNVKMENCDQCQVPS